MDAKADRACKAEALKFVVHFVGDMHQPLHDEDDGDKGGNARHVIFDGKPDNLHWIWDITAEDLEAWDKGSIEEWVHGLLWGHAGPRGNILSWR